MQIDHIHFYAEDAQRWQTWFTQKWGLQTVQQVDCLADSPAAPATPSAVVEAGAVRLKFSAPSSENCPVSRYLDQHPAGVADLAFCVTSLEAFLRRAVQLKAEILQPVYWGRDAFGSFRAACIRGWGDLRHTLIERSQPQGIDRAAATTDWLGIDHVVLNVEQGSLGQAVCWYEQLFGFQRCQNFAIQTAYSALCSQVLRHPDSGFQMPINEPASASSQIQEFLDWNRGSGIQHIALRVRQILPLIEQMRQNGIAFLTVPSSYYEQLAQRPGLALTASEQAAVAQQEVLVDWRLDGSEALLLQAFTQPIFEQPTFFFELIERRRCPISQRFAEGFGEGNFQALFEAIEREQIKRGGLPGARA
ncbi:MAG: 4-hydroxyphenylpyruvate dioxygenase [Pegethrix bostrychoides GSE-TBD4-15B]|jgi:4-hydroxyphenylpyruvate dioxygenase|uniref:4-hydroxyphenylpyruvate dioxygenase n=1 Tax=Pegethrix bostrychoides GSE-TBD4-15B TaxID=2839662 RepID=A0A951P716_9CYAN|nr:4-hydroxyphenylpyruvate dioxygenase [Pegethrix bostrychoides GSE-TBD4-15B]